MENSILISTKQVLGVGEGYTVFDLDIITHINAAFSVINQIGIGPTEGFFIEGETEVWADLALPATQLNLVKTYILLKVRLLFDPPGTGFLIDVMTKQINEYEWRLNLFRESEIA